MKLPWKPLLGTIPVLVFAVAIAFRGGISVRAQENAGGARQGAAAQGAGTGEAKAGGFYNGDKFPQWKGNMLMATMTRSVLRVTFDAKGNPTGPERMLTELKQRFRDIRSGPDGCVYLLTDETFGAVLRMEPAK